MGGERHQAEDLSSAICFPKLHRVLDVSIGHTQAEKGTGAHRLEIEEMAEAPRLGKALVGIVTIERRVDPANPARGNGQIHQDPRLDEHDPRCKDLGPRQFPALEGDVVVVRVLYRDGRIEQEVAYIQPIAGGPERLRPGGCRAEQRNDDSEADRDPNPGYCAEAWDGGTVGQTGAGDVRNSYAWASRRLFGKRSTTLVPGVVSARAAGWAGTYSGTSSRRAAMASSARPSIAAVSRASRERHSSSPRGTIPVRTMILSFGVGKASSESPFSSSCSFSPGRRPVKTILMSLSGFSPESSIMFRAMSTIRTGCPIWRRNVSFPPPIAPAVRTSCTASGIVMKYRDASGCVTVTGPPRAICLRNVGITDPSLPRTLPNRTAMNRVRPASKLFTRRSPSLFVAPMTLVGRTALSVET